MIFVVGYYGTETMGLIREAHRRGILSVDVQHGLITANHLAYSGSKRFAATGFDTLPNAFLLWSREEAAVIKKWTQELPNAPEAVIGGNLLLEAWREGTLPWIKADLERVRQMRAPLGSVKHAVFTLQGFETADDLRELAEVVVRTRGSFYWWFRLHPVHPDGRGAMEAALRSAGAENATVQASTDLPLYAVLKEADIHLTRYSSSVLEAAAFGVPSVVTSEKDSTFFGPELAQGWAVVAEGPEAIVAAVQSQVAATPELRAAASAPRSANPEAAIDRLLELRARLSASR
jgi:hypothetical protein